MTSRLAAISRPALLVMFAGALYLARLGDAPLYVSHDEAVYSLQAHALATTGHDLNGRFLPMFIEYPARFGRPTWNQPIQIYAIAATLEILPFSEAAIRLPMALAAIVDVVLIYFIARILFASELLAVTAAVLLALTPAHFMHSRSATDFQLSVPFVLGWLLSLLLYLRRGQPRLLFLAGAVLGVGVYAYVAAYLVTPILAAWTAVLMRQRREAAQRYGVLAAGLALPTIVCLPWMLQHPLPFRDILAHYTVLGGAPSNRTGILGLVAGFAEQRLVEIPALYASFWDPRFLFVDGPLRFRSIQQVGVFLLALAGFAVGVIRAAARRSPTDLTLLVALLAAPLPASLAGEPQAIWRALHMAPFAVLLAVLGLQQITGGAATVAGRTALMATYPIVCALAAWYHDVVPDAQALVRAAIVPMAIVGLAGMFRRIAVDRLPLVKIGVVVASSLAIMHGVYLVADYALPVGIVLLAGICLLGLLPPGDDRLGRWPFGMIAIVALIAGHLLYLYVDYDRLPRLDGIPASLGVLAARLTVALAACAAVVFVGRVLARTTAADRPSGKAAAAGIVVIQLAYFLVDYFADYRLRAIHVSIVLAAAVGLALIVRESVYADRTFGRMMLAGIFGLAAIQFTTFSADYFTDFRARNVDAEGNVRFAFESAIERSRDRNVPAVYLGALGPYQAAPLYWQFYLVKHRREELLSGTIPALEFNRDRIRALPAGSVVITRPSSDTDRSIAAMIGAGELTAAERLEGRDGAPSFWVLETAVR